MRYVAAQPRPGCRSVPTVVAGMGPRDRTGARRPRHARRRHAARSPGRGASGGRRRTSPTIPLWWRSAVIYEIYVRSFADGNGDGTGDLAGVRAHLPYLRDLGVDAIWFTPWYLSPLADGGYDVADYRVIDPAFGTLEEAETLIAEALDVRDPDHHRRRPQPRLEPPRLVPGGARGGPGIAGAGALLVPPRPRAERRRAPDRLAVGVQGRAHLDAHDEPGRDARRLVPPPVHGRAARPQLGPPGRARRARVDPPLLVRPGRRAACGSTPPRCSSRTRRCRRSRRTPSRASTRSTTATSSTTSTAAGAPIADALPGDARPRRRGLARGRRAVRPATSARTSSTRRSTSTSWPGPGTPHSLRASIDATLASHAPVGAPATWVLSNHDVTRPVTRYGRERLVVRVRPQAVRDADGRRPRQAPGPGRGAADRRAPGLALPLPGRRAGARRGRGPAARDPGPDARPLRGRRPGPRRLPGPAAVERRRRAVRVQPGGRVGAAVAQPAGPLVRADRRAAGIRSIQSMLHLYRAALHARRVVPGLGDGPLTWVPSDPGVLAFERGRRVPMHHQPVQRRAAAAAPARRSSWPARTSQTVTFRPTRRSGCGRTRSPRAQRGGCPPTRAERRLTTATRTTGRRRTSQATHRGRDQRGAAMRSTTRRPASILTAFAVIAIVVAACGGTTATATPAATAAPHGSPEHRGHRGPEPGRRARAGHDRRRRPSPRRHPGSRRRAVPADRPVPGEVPLDHGRARGVQLDGADVHRGPRRRARCPTSSPSRSPTGRGSSRTTRSSTSTRASGRSATPTSSTPTSSSTARTPTARSSPSRPPPTACR